EIGMLTPPVGMNVFVLKGVLKDVPLSTIFRGVLPFWIADIFRLALLVAVPGLSLWLVQAM
ncbi:MAG: TRAP transporter large permease subunit, partial [Hyphomicrobiales bacterium]|nr:TRAP transporter large permease subunit [Hyphomicrobiales bacterium]